MKQRIKKFLLNILGIKVIFNFINIFFKNNLVVLMYHDVNNRPDDFYKKNDLNVYLKNFIRQIKFIKKNYNILKPNFENFDQKTSNILVTFDDGCKSYMRNALPILTKNKVYSINFLNFDVVEKKIMWPMFLNELMNLKKIPITEYYKINNMDYLIKKYKKNINLKKYNKYFLSKKDLKKIDKNKYCYFGSHLFHHLNCTTLKKNYLKKMIYLNHKKLKNYKNYIKYFSYPYGQKKINYNERTDKVVLSNTNEKIFYADYLNINKSNKKFGRINMTNSILTENNLRAIILYTLILSKLKFWS